MKKFLACASMMVLLLGTVLVAQWYQKPLEGTEIPLKELDNQIDNWAMPDEEYLKTP
jgi:opacity protein-like surface antigen